MRHPSLQALQQVPRSSGPVAPAKAEVLVQRESSLGPSGPMSAPAIQDAGQALAPEARSQMERGFGRDFGHVRVHDDARAHGDARALGARAYAAGEHVVFGEGQYRPETAAGRALIAHELAHVVHQGGVQLKADGPMPAHADAGLEAEADRAAAAVTGGGAAPALSQINRGAVFRNASNTPPPPAAALAPAVAPTPAAVASAKPAVTPPVAAGPPQRLPAGMTAVRDDPPGLGTTELVINVASFALPAEKGAGDWVQKAYSEASAGQRLVFSPLIESNKVAAYKEGAEDYKSVWLGNFGFKTTSGLADAFTAALKTSDEVKAANADKSVASLVLGMKSSLQASHCDIDHIVEKQMGGTSIPSNLQLLVSDKNQKSGRETYQKLVDLVEQVRDPSMRGPKVKRLQLVLQSVTVPSGSSDPSFVVESLLRKGLVKGKDEVKAASEGKPVSLSAGGVGETVNIKDTGKTTLDTVAKRIIPGIRLSTYVRGPGGVKSKVDKGEGELDSRAVSKTSAANATVHLTAELPSGDGPAPSIGAAAGGDAKEANAAAAELRVLKLDAKTNKKVAFYYPYLSPGELTSLTMDEQGTLAGEGTISPTVPIFDKLAVRFKAGRSGDDLLELVAPIAAEKLKPNNSVFRFTSGELALQLSPSFLPKGTLAFEVGPKGKPVILGELTAKLEGGAFVATGTLKPGGKVPGISDAAGEVSFNSDTGWAGKLTAKSTAIPGATVDAELGFTSSRDGLNPYGRGGLHMDIKGSPLDLAVAWRGGALSYSGSVTILKPLPLVEKVKLSGQYANDAIALSGEAAIKWKSIAANMTVLYVRKDGEEGRFSGTATVSVKTEKADGSISLSFDEAGHYWGKGSLTYQVTKDIRPTLGVELTKDQRVRLFGEVAVGTIPLSGIWPPPAGGKVSIIKGIGAKFNIPTPVPGITAYGELRGSLSLGYGVGPVMLVGVKFSGELYPLEDDPKVKAKLAGSFAVPAYASLEGTFGAYVGVEVLLGAAGAKGGIDVTPGLTIRGEGGLAIDADYDASGFSFSAEAYAKGTLNATVKVDLVAEIYAVWGLFSHSWKYNVADLSKQIGPELKLSLGKIAYAKDGKITWPDPSQIKLEPENIDPLEVVKELMGKGKAEKVAEGGGAGAGSYAPPIA